MRKIRKTNLVIGSLIVTALISTLAIGPAEAYINDVDFLGPLYRDYDPYYGDWVTAYKEGSIVTVAVTVNNYGYYHTPHWYYETANISAVGIRFDWMDEYVNSTECGPADPYELDYYSWHTFLIEVTLPTLVAEPGINLYTHSFDVMVENKNGTGGLEVIWTDGGSDFAIYSTDQANAQELRQDVDAALDATGSIYFSSVEARMSLAEAEMKASTGDSSYQRGNFTGATAYYTSALELIDQAFEAEIVKGTAIEDANLNYMNADTNYRNSLGIAAVQNANASMALADAAKTEADAAQTEADAAQTEADASMALANAAQTEANAAMAQANGLADAANTEAYAWLLFGLAAVLVGFATIIYAFRKTKVPETPLPPETIE